MDLFLNFQTSNHMIVQSFKNPKKRIYIYCLLFEIYTTGRLCIVMEYAPHGDLSTFLQQSEDGKNNLLDLKHVASFGYQISNAMMHLGEIGVRCMYFYCRQWAKYLRNCSLLPELCLPDTGSLVPFSLSSLDLWLTSQSAGSAKVTEMFYIFLKYFERQWDTVWRKTFNPLRRCSIFESWDSAWNFAILSQIVLFIKKKKCYGGEQDLSWDQSLSLLKVLLFEEMQNIFLNRYTCITAQQIYHAQWVHCHKSILSLLSI